MLYNAANPAEYLELLDNDWRKETLVALRELIREKAPEIPEGIQYKMLHYGTPERSLFHLNAQKNYVSLYVGNTKKIDNSGELLAGLDLGKGCIRFKKSVAIDQTKIDQFIDEAVRLWRAGAELDC